MAQDLLLIGCGKMGGALLTGWLAADLVERVVVVEPSEAGLPAGLGDDPRVTHLRDAGALPDDAAPAIAVLAVKPQRMEEVIPVCRRLADRGTCFLSIAAGKTLAWFEDRLGADAAIVRAMPNTPAAIGRGVTALVANHAPRPSGWMPASA